ncbi:acetyl-CoA acetyltransferase [Emcibacter sp. SYSU 3D8]|uniref:acetyl-CoA acetyltransferase n=1 Tax=Emcibacter sp. SYSU 3D8 TaxID=3133969 RepID=UPI0031FF3F38
MAGIRDKVAIIGMGCSKFGERWDASPDDLMLEAYTEALADAAIAKEDIQMAWLGVFFDEQNVGKSAIPLSQALRLPNIPVTRVENLCATGTEALRGAVYAVAAGACDIAMALGVEKLKDTGYGGLPERTKGTFEDLWQPNSTAPGSFAQMASAYSAKHGVDMQDLKRAMAHVSWKSHQNGAKSPKAHLQSVVDMDKILNAPMVSFPLGLFDCCGVSDGAACAIVTTPEKAREMGFDNPVVVKALQLAASNGVEMSHNSWDGSYTMTTRMAAQRAYAEAGIKDPLKEISLTEVHDCFSITELVVMEDLGLSKEGQGYKDILNGKYDADGEVPCQIDGGLKCFGHPIGASGLRMAYEVYTQINGRAGARQLKDPVMGLTHNLGGIPNRNVCSVSILGRLNQ